MDATGRIEVFARLRPPAIAPAALGPGRRGNLPATTPLKDRAVRKLVSPLGGAPRPSSIVVEDALEAFASGLRSNVVSFEFDDSSSSVQRFELDGVFEPCHAQRDVWLALGRPHIDSVVEGYNSTIFAYGRTCSGKTHTITGPINAPGGWALADLEREDADPAVCASLLGLVPRALYALLKAVEAQRESRRFAASFACAEIYNKSLFDLAAGEHSGGGGGEAAGSGGGRVEVRDGRMTTSAADRLSWHALDLRVGCEDDALLAVQSLVQRANAARVTAATAANADSSRSHVLYLCRVTSVGADGTAREALLSIVDLAGSESLDAKAGGGSGEAAGGPSADTAVGGMGSPTPKHGAAASGRDAETRAINSSLHTLTRVVAAYAAAPAGQRPSHVPWRESLLTLMLKDSIGGNCRTTVVVTLSGDDDQLLHSYKSCQFARLARGVRNCARANRCFDPASLVESLRTQVAELRAELEAQRGAAEAAAMDAAASGPGLEVLMTCAKAGPGLLAPAAVDTRLREWAEAALPWDEPASLSERVQQLAVVTDSLKRCVRATEVPTCLDAPPTKDCGVETAAAQPLSPPAAPVAKQVASVGAQVTPPALSPALSPFTAGASGRSSAPSTGRRHLHMQQRTPLSARSLHFDAAILSRMQGSQWLTPAERDAEMRLAAGQLAAACDGNARDVENRALPPARLIAALSARLNEGDDTSSMRVGRVGMLEAHIRAERAVAARLRDPATIASTVAPHCHPHLNSGECVPLGSSAVVHWQVRRDDDSCSGGAREKWVPVSSAIAALLEEAARKNAARAASSASDGYAEATVVLHRGESSTLAVCGAPFCCLIAAASSAQDASPRPPRVVPHPALASAWQQPVGCDGITPFSSSVLDCRSGLEVCVYTGATRLLRRCVSVISQGLLSKRGRKNGAWRSRSFVLTPTGLYQVSLDADGAAAKAKIDASAASETLWARARISKTKVSFSAAVSTTASLLPPVAAASDPRDSASFVVMQRLHGSGRLTEQSFAAGSFEEAIRWVDAINVAARGAFTSSQCSTSAQGLKCSVRMVKAPTMQDRSDIEEASFLRWLTAAQLMHNGGDSSRSAALHESLSPVAADQRDSMPADGMDWCGRGPGGVPALIPITSGEWRSLGEPMISELVACEGVAGVARTLAFPSFAVLVLAAASIRSTAAAAAFEAYCCASAAHDTTVFAHAYSVAPSRAVLRRLVAYPEAAEICASACEPLLGSAQNAAEQACLLPQLAASRPKLHRTVSSAVDAHVSLLQAMRGAHPHEPAQSLFGHAASLLAIVVYRTMEPVTVSTAADRGVARDLHPATEVRTQRVCALPTHVIWVQVAHGPAETCG